MYSIGEYTGIVFRKIVPYLACGRSNTTITIESACPAGFLHLGQLCICSSSPTLTSIFRSHVVGISNMKPRIWGLVFKKSFYRQVIFPRLRPLGRAFSHTGRECRVGRKSSRYEIFVGATPISRAEPLGPTTNIRQLIHVVFFIISTPLGGVLIKDFHFRNAAAVLKLLSFNKEGV